MSLKLIFHLNLEKTRLNITMINEVDYVCLFPLLKKRRRLENKWASTQIETQKPTKMGSGYSRCLGQDTAKNL